MQTICRLIRLSPEAAAKLAADPESLPDRLASAVVYSDVYRYWHAIEFLLARHRPGQAAAQWLASGTPVSEPRADLPASRLLSCEQVAALDRQLREIQPEDLVPHYDAAALDAAGVYPATWQAWEEDFDPLGQVLEHYFFLQEFTSQCAEAGSALLLRFEELAEGSV